jgi:hypothetical protein
MPLHGRGTYNPKYDKLNPAFKDAATRSYLRSDLSALRVLSVLRVEFLSCNLSCFQL